MIFEDILSEKTSRFKESRSVLTAQTYVLLDENGNKINSIVLDINTNWLPPTGHTIELYSAWEKRTGGESIPTP